MQSKRTKIRTKILCFVQFIAALLMATASFFVPAHAAYTEDYGGAYGHWAYEAMAWAADSGVILNGSADRADPDESLTRAEMATMIARLYRTYQGTDVSRYTDLSPDTWYHDYIAQTVRMGAVTGYSSTRMGPDDLITREQAMTILARIICLPDGDSKVLARFRDRDQIGPWARDTIAAMAANGYVKGYSDNCLYPKRTVTRAQMVQMMYNIFRNTYDSGAVTGTFSGNVLVRGSTDIHDAVIEGDLFLANMASASTSVTVTNTAPVLTSYTADSTRTMKNGRYYADLRAACSDPDGDEVHLEWSSEYQPDGYYEVGTHTIQVRAVDEWGAVSAWQTRIIEFINSAPTITSFTADVTRRVSGNTFYADVKADASDPDGDVVKLEWDGDYSSSGWYARGSEHTVRVRAVDEYGAASPWQERSFEFVNQAPSKPVITKTPSGGVVRPSETVTITAASTDPEGDTITYEWDGRTAESAKYGYGKQLIKCRAADAYGATSPWAAIVFFVADNNGGGMTLTSANSFIEEPGISFEADGETINGYITEYTYDVPAVSGHNGDDYGKIEAYNVLTNTWDQIAYQTTNNGVTLTGVLPTGTYTQMRFYYYTKEDTGYEIVVLYDGEQHLARLLQPQEDLRYIFVLPRANMARELILPGVPCLFATVDYNGQEIPSVKFYSEGVTSNGTE